MSQIKPLIQTLKRALKAQGLTYRDVAEVLGISEISVKRMFSSKSGTITLQRLEAICQLIGLDLTDLVQSHERAKRHISRLTQTQEQELASDLSLLLVALLVRNGWSFDDILARYRFTEPECIRRLTHLDRLGLIELLPGNRFRLRVASNFQWLPHGPIETFFEQNVQNEFLCSRFDADGEFRLYLSAHLTVHSRDRLTRALQRVATEFSDLQQADGNRSVDERTNTGLLVAMRPWALNAFEDFRR